MPKTAGAEPSEPAPPARAPHLAPPAARVLSPRAARTAAHYLKRILTARVYDVAVESALEPARSLSRRLGNHVLLKREDQQPVFSFKLRGAFNKMVHLPPEVLARGVVCASAGNHAQGVALAARRLGTQAVVVMPVTTPKLKVDAVQALGGEVVLQGDSYSDAYQHALQVEQQRGLAFVHPFDDPDVIAGQGTVAMEILRQHQGPLDAVFVAIGGGGLVSGVAAYIKAVRPEVRVIGVQTVDSDAMVRSVRSRRRVQLADVGLFSDGTAVKQVGRETLRVTRELVDDFVLVDTDARLRRDQGCVPGHAQRARAGGRARGGGDQAVRAPVPHQGPDPGGRDLRCEHELRPPALRRRAGRIRRAARGPVRRHHPRGAWLVQALLRAGRATRRDRVQLPHLRPAGRPCLRPAWRSRARDEADRIARNFVRHGFPRPWT
jgi:threonine dehydratase